MRCPFEAQPLQAMAFRLDLYAAYILHITLVMRQTASIRSTCATRGPVVATRHPKAKTRKSPPELRRLLLCPAFVCYVVLIHAAFSDAVAGLVTSWRFYHSVVQGR